MLYIEVHTWEWHSYFLCFTLIIHYDLLLIRTNPANVIGFALCFNPDHPKRYIYWFKGLIDINIVECRRLRVQSPAKDRVIPKTCLALIIKTETLALSLENSNNTIFKGLIEDLLKSQISTLVIYRRNKQNTSLTHRGIVMLAHHILLLELVRHLAH